jgi:hypothetical protein
MKYSLRSGLVSAVAVTNICLPTLIKSGAEEKIKIKNKYLLYCRESETERESLQMFLRRDRERERER